MLFSIGGRSTYMPSFYFRIFRFWTHTIIRKPAVQFSLSNKNRPCIVIPAILRFDKASLVSFATPRGPFSPTKMYSKKLRSILLLISFAIGLIVYLLNLSSISIRTKRRMLEKTAIRRRETTQKSISKYT
jgi:hypothetical protein